MNPRARADAVCDKLDGFEMLLDENRKRLKIFIAAELEAYAKEKVDEEWTNNMEHCEACSKNAVLNEREACAKVAEEFKMHGMNCSLILWTDEQCSCEAGPIADAIRARGAK